MLDLEADANAVRPIAYGGTGAATAEAARKALGLEIGVKVPAYADGVPTGVILDFAGSTAPDGWLFCYGQVLSRTKYPALFAKISTSFNTGGESSTQFRLPDCRGRVTAGKDNMGGTVANRLTSTGGVAGTTLGATGGSQTHILTVAQMPAHNHGGSTSNESPSVHGIQSLGGAQTGGAGDRIGTGGQVGTVPHNHAIDSQGGGQAHPIVQPTIIFNKIIKAV